MQILRWWQFLLFFIILYFINENQINCESQIKFEMKNVTNEYETKINPIENKHMKIWFKMMNGFVSIVSPKISIIKDFILKMINISQNKRFKSEYIKEELKSQYRIFICAIVGLLYVAIMWIAGLIFCCCRMCNNCGGKKAQDETNTTSIWRKIFIFSLIVLTIFLLVPVVCMFVINNTLNKSYDVAEETITTSLTDTKLFLSNNKNQLGFLVLKNMNIVVTQIIKDLDNIDRYVKNALENEDLLKTLKSSLTSFGGFIIAIPPEMEIFKNSIVTNYKELINIKEKLKKIQDEVIELKKKCDNEENIKNACAEIDSSKFTLENFISIDVTLLQNIQINFFNFAQSYKSMTDEVKQTIDDLPSKIKVDIDPIVKELKSTLKDFMQTVEKQIQQLDKEISPIIHEINKVQNETKIIIKEGRHYDKIRWYIGLAICIVLTITVSGLLLGLFCGICGYNSNRQATKRTNMSNCGGFFLMFVVYWMLFFSGLLMLLTIVLFVGGSIGDIYICKTLYDEKLIDQIVNATQNQNKALKNNLLNDVVPSEILSKCKQDETLYSVLNIEEKMNVSSMLNFEERLNIDEYKKKLSKTINIPKIEVFTENVDKSINNFIKSLVLFEKEIAKVNNINIDIAQQLNVFTLLIEIPSLKPEIKNDTIAINESSTVISENFQEIKKNFQFLLNKLIASKTSIEGLKNLLRLTDGQLKENIPEIVKKITDNFVKTMLGYGKDFVDFFKKNIMLIGQCKQMVVVFDAIRTTVCTNYIQILNGFWFGLGWSLFFFIPTIFVAIKLSKHFYRMKYVLKKDKDEKDDYNIELAHRNKIRPDNGCYPPIQHYETKEKY